jgi:hypothetical protein
VLEDVQAPFGSPFSLKQKRGNGVQEESYLKSKIQGMEYRAP